MAEDGFRLSGSISVHDSHNINHAEGWNAALDKALAQIDWDPGMYEVKVEFFATIAVANPGHIQNYTAVVSG
jgi:hypothetical protein